MIDNETIMIKLLIKELLKENKCTQADLAEHLKISLPSVKRLLGKEDISLKRLGEVALFFNLKTSNFFEMIKSRELNYSKVTTEQENLFMKDITNLKVFRLLILGLRSEEIRGRYSLTSKKYNEILASLEKVNLIERWPNDRIRVLKKWPFEFSENGRFKTIMVPRFISELLTRLKSTNNLSLAELALSEENYRGLNEDIKKVYEKYRKLSASDMKNYNYKKLKEATVVSSVLHDCIWDYFDNSI